MTTTEQDHVVTDPVEDAETACDALEDALRTLGITLPSLWVDAGPSAPFLSCHPPLVELGRCNVETARALTVALLAGTASGGTR
ncbi:hypothetical protein PJ985_01725 [Streptomyces sp. ACA25]|uniref:hypothetical protein n=1 Tax=Streptomyces sp. ACA25 TaxID=3022596 RepID=UPI002307BA38|nr:hypothetical protein [Streptomyces sp. ACA25]MDB1086291.1 hypothetical protein [Streptomyces sp. ACA25]